MSYSEENQQIEALITVFRQNEEEEDESAIVREKAAEDLAHMGPIVLPRLLMALKEEHPLVRRGACDALGQLQDSQAVPDLIQMLSDEDEEVHIGRIWGASIPRDVPDPLPEERRSALEDQVKSAYGERLLDLLLTTFSDPEYRVRSGGVLTVGRIAEQRSLPALLALQHHSRPDDPPDFQRFVTWAIERIQKKSGECS